MKIVINATAAITSGALTIIRDFLTEAANHEINFVVFCCADLEYFRSNRITIIKLPVKGYLSRILWDYNGFSGYLRKHQIYPSLIVSFQNTGVVYCRKVPQLIYYHNPIPFTKIKWKFSNRNERLFWFYKHIYPFFIRNLIRNNSFFVVQANWIKRVFAEKFDVSIDRIKVIPPSLAHPIHPGRQTNLFKKRKQTLLFYPATAFIYKNHKVILQALEKITVLEIGNSIEVVFTITKDDIKKMGLESYYNKVKEHVHLKGMISPAEVFEIYNKSDGILFPSTVETFGLPLMEASALNKYILCADEEYAYETLNGYSNVKFIPSNDPDAWFSEIRNLLNDNQIALDGHGKIKNREGSWKDVLKYIQEIINIQQGNVKP